MSGRAGSAGRGCDTGGADGPRDDGRRRREDAPGARLSEPFEALYTALDRALAFVRARGGALDGLRLCALLQVAPAAEVADALACRQLASGAFPPLAPAPAAGGSRGEPGGTLARFGAAPAGPGPTLAALSWLADLRALEGVVVARAVGFLERAQRADGAFAPGPEAPAQDVLALTGLLAGVLARARATPPALLAAAARHLDAALGASRAAGGARSLPVLAGLASYLANTGGARSGAALQGCGRDLEHAYRTGALDAAGAARVLTLCDALALPGARVDSAELLGALLAAQREDGGFGAGPDADRVAVTLDASLALVRFAPTPAEAGAGA